MANVIAGERENSERVHALLRDWSMELSARDTKALDATADHLPAGASLYLNWIPGDTHHRTVAAAVKLRAAGINPVPHIGARHLTGFTQLQDFLARLAGEANVQRVLTIGGDRDRPAGPFESALQLLETDLFQKYGVTRVGIAGYPEGNPRIAPDVLDDALTAKIARARRSGLQPYIVTQFCFEAAPILNWIRALRGRGIDVPVRIGLAGPASITTLMKYALRCGVGNSVRALGLRGTAIARLLAESTPERVIADIAAAGGQDELGIDGLHLFNFGGFARTADWTRAQAAS
jgi:methylenetetrahydrofolate reductase (NADPH)